MDFTSLVHDPVFATFGVPATLAPASGGSHSVTVRDRTKGVELTDLNVDLATVEPVAVIRAAELASLGVALSDLDEGTITFNGTSWRIHHHIERPSPFGAGDGTVWLVLIQGAS